MLELVTLTPAFGMRNVSPFCLKVEMLLTHLKVPFKHTEEGDPRKAPKGKLPFLITDGERIADSELIVEHINQLTQGKVYADLTPAQRAQGLALTRLAEEHLYWVMVSARWLDDAWWPNVVAGFFGAVPKLARGLVAGMARKQMRKTYDLQGLGRHTHAEQEGFARRDLAALQDACNNGEDFLFGSGPCVYDFAIVGIMAGIYDNQPATWLTRVANEYPALKEYTERTQRSVGVFGRSL